ncbi:MAG: hypothetical protein AABY64_05900 [Bdellovibrionota bacterium]|mgnify:CR=1 FL=1
MIMKSVATIMFALCMMSNANADSKAGSKPDASRTEAPHSGMHKLFADCAAKNHINITDPKALTAEQRKIIYQCMKDARQEAKAACLQETRVTPPAEGQHMSPEDRAKMKECMKSKGFTGHHGHGRHHGEQCAPNHNPKPTPTHELDSADGSEED